MVEKGVDWDMKFIEREALEDDRILDQSPEGLLPLQRLHYSCTVGPRPPVDWLNGLVSPKTSGTQVGWLDP
ncbi:hypothetical protein Y1Q_0011516 [Alligator mississippiensis]|uniref:Uncharacterized protein n=1 Tax=Alligator mississippiensis TaxID=8496 RepID=A0A151M012_ALLMI|nr:hypothetical protein Y1Q_0011516 [Alligator mississippiensis]